MLRVVLVATSTTGGGAAVATMRLYKSLRAVRGVDVRLITLWGDGGGDEHIDVLSCHSFANRWRGQVYRYLERLAVLPHIGFSHHLLWRYSLANYGFELIEHPWVKSANVLHLHWVNHGLLSLKSLQRLITLPKAIIWTLHDLWALTGGCHIPYLMGEALGKLCQAWGEGCLSCPLISSASGRKTFTAEEYKRKHFLRTSRIRYVAVSKAEAELVAKVIGEYPVVIPPSLSLEDIAPPSINVRSDEEGPLALLAVAGKLTDPVKGANLLVLVLNRVYELAPQVLRTRLRAVLVGVPEGERVFATLRMPRLEYLSMAESELDELYRSSAVLLSTSIYETFGQTLSEALARGVPVVSFDSVGASDLLEQGACGLCVPAYDVDAMAKAILQVLSAPEAYPSSACRQSVAHLDGELVAKQYVDLYQSQLRK